MTELPARVRADGRGEWTLCAVRDCGCRLAQIYTREQDGDWVTLQLDGWSHVAGAWEKRRAAKQRRERRSGERIYGGVRTAAPLLGAVAGGRMLASPVKLRCPTCQQVNVLTAALLKALTD